MSWCRPLPLDTAVRCICWQRASGYQQRSRRRKMTAGKDSGDRQVKKRNKRGRSDVLQSGYLPVLCRQTKKSAGQT